jgi:hypothetical protein
MLKRFFLLHFPYLMLFALPPLLAPPADDARCLFRVGLMSGLKPVGTSLLWPQRRVTRGEGTRWTSRHMSKTRTLIEGEGACSMLGPALARLIVRERVGEREDLHSP